MDNYHPTRQPPERPHHLDETLTIQRTAPENIPEIVPFSSLSPRRIVFAAYGFISNLAIHLYSLLSRVVVVALGRSVRPPNPARQMAPSRVWDDGTNASTGRSNTSDLSWRERFG